jgi:16S rRNA (uracil1498-N3)-methyltransferase
MPHFYVPPENIRGDRFVLAEEESRHVTTVLRKVPGDELRLFDGRGGSFQARIESVAEGRVAGRLMPLASAPETVPPVRLFQGLPKGPKFDWILEKAAELGVAEVVPMATDRSVARVPADRVQDRLRRWNKVLQAAAKQSGRTILPRVQAPLRFDEALTRCAGLGSLTVIPWEGEKDQTLPAVLRQRLAGTPPGPINVFIGPEGGFTFEEVNRARAHGAVPVTLGSRILRTETAAVFVLSAISYERLGIPS